MMVPLSTLALAATILSSSGLINALSASDIPADTPISSLLSTAQSHLTKGETTEALVYYDAAIARDPNDYLTFFKRATTYLSLGRTPQATSDFNRVLELKPGFEGAHLQLGKLKARSADWSGAKEQYLLAKQKPGSSEFETLIEAEGAATLAETAAATGNWEECVTQAGEAIKVATRAAHLRELRANCRFESGDIVTGLNDLQHVLQMKPGDTTPHLKISATTFYSLGNTEQGLAQIRKCLHSDPDSKSCKKLMKQEKSVEKTWARVAKSLEKNQPMSGVKLLVPSGDEPGLINEVKEHIKELKQEGIIPEKAPNDFLSKLVESACQAYYEANGKKASTYCTEALALDENSFYGLLYKAKTLLDAEEYDACIETLKKAQEDRSDKQKNLVNPLMQKAQVALKRSKTKDYYKILGVPHDADERQIKAAYRKATKQHHPDKAIKQGLTKEAAEKKMAGINEAYEVLSNPELRARFDRGDDPNSQEQQNPFQGNNPFGGGSPFMFQQGGGQQFQFKFGSQGRGGFPGGGFPFS
ncbi:DnaJ domain-containing protein [Biscogniauxia mediterranea]|nr:DnaJ domain-containing protein [Biscogniauxia mediterranea]